MFKINCVFDLKHELNFLLLNAICILKLSGNNVFNLSLIDFNAKSFYCSWKGSNSKWIFSSFVVEDCSKTSIGR